MAYSTKSGKIRRNKITGDGDIIVKRMTLPGIIVSSTAGQVIAVNTATDTTLVQSAPASEWASFAARYQQYRVRSVTMIMEPVFPGSGTPVGVAADGHGALYVSDFIGGSVPGSAAQVLSDEGAVCSGTSKRIVYTVDWARNPNAKLWNPTSAVIPTANSFGIAYASDTTTVLVASTNYFVRTTLWEVEFRGSQ